MPVMQNPGQTEEGADTESDPGSPGLAAGAPGGRQVGRQTERQTHTPPVANRPATFPALAPLLLPNTLLTSIDSADVTARVDGADVIPSALCMKDTRAVITPTVADSTSMLPYRECE